MSYNTYLNDDHHVLLENKFSYDSKNNGRYEIGN